MKVLNKEVIELIHKIQELVIEIPTMTMYYQSNVYVLSVYSFEEETKYHKHIYVDGFSTNEKQVIQDLKDMIRDLEAMKIEIRSKSKHIS